MMICTQCYSRTFNYTFSQFCNNHSWCNEKVHVNIEQSCGCDVTLHVTELSRMRFVANVMLCRGITQSHCTRDYFSQQSEYFLLLMYMYMCMYLIYKFMVLVNLQFGEFLCTFQWGSPEGEITFSAACWHQRTAGKAHLLGGMWILCWPSCSLRNSQIKILMHCHRRKQWVIFTHGMKLTQGRPAT